MIRYIAQGSACCKYTLPMAWKKIMKKDTNRALITSLAVHITLILAVSHLITQRSTEIKDYLSVDIHKISPIQQVRRRILRTPRQSNLMPTHEKQISIVPLVSPTHTYRAPIANALIHTDSVSTVITHAKIPETSMPANDSLGNAIRATHPISLLEHRGTGTGISGHHQKKNIGIHKFASLTQVEDLGVSALDDPSMGKGALNSDEIRNNDIDMGLGIFSTVTKPGHGLVGEVYVPGGAISKIPVFEGLSPIHTFVTANLDVPTRDYTHGFPVDRIRNVTEDFAIRFRGTLLIGMPGKYTFGLFSDDGAKLYINKALVVDNDGVHPPQLRRGDITLRHGAHPVEIHYFQGPQYEIALQWFYQPPYSSEQVVPPEVIFLPSK